MNRRLSILVVLSAAVLLVNSALLAAFPTATAFNVANLLLHVGLGAAAGVAALVLSRVNRNFVWMFVAGVSGAVLTVLGNTHDHRAILWIHIVLALLAVAVLFARRENFAITRIALAATAAVVLGGVVYRYGFSHPDDHIVNSR